MSTVSNLFKALLRSISDIRSHQMSHCNVKVLPGQLLPLKTRVKVNIWQAPPKKDTFFTGVTQPEGLNDFFNPMGCPYCSVFGCEIFEAFFSNTFAKKLDDVGSLLRLLDGIVYTL